MAGSLNKVQLIGNLGQDPEVRALPNGGKVVNLSVATSERWRDKQTGEQREKTEWHRVVIWSEGLAKVAEQYLRKGAKVYVEGQLQTRKWQDQQGQDRYSTEIVLQGFNAALTMLDSRRDGEQSSASQAPAEQPQRQEQQPQQPYQPAARPTPEQGPGRPARPAADQPAIDDDIPF